MQHLLETSFVITVLLVQTLFEGGLCLSDEMPLLQLHLYKYFSPILLVQLFLKCIDVILLANSNNKEF